MTADDPRQWIAFADADLNVIRDVLAGESESWAHACYLGQQAAEKMLKAYLVTHRIVPMRTHDLARLLNACARFRPTTNELVNDARLLNRYPVTTRYPGDVELPTRQEAEDAQAAASRIAATVRRWIAEEYSEQS